MRRIKKRTSVGFMVAEARESSIGLQRRLLLAGGDWGVAIEWQLGDGRGAKGFTSAGDGPSSRPHLPHESRELSHRSGPLAQRRCCGRLP